MDTEIEDGHLQAEERSLRTKQPCRHLALRLVAPRIVRKKTSVVKPLGL